MILLKDIPIKFRGKRIKDGTMIYGDLEHYFKDVCIRYEDKDEPLTYFIDKVVKDSIAQLCGYDAEGNEVYEGDKLICKNSHFCDCIIASLESSIVQMVKFMKENNFVLER